MKHYLKRLDNWLDSIFQWLRSGPSRFTTLDKAFLHELQNGLALRKEKQALKEQLQEMQTRYQQEMEQLNSQLEQLSRIAIDISFTDFLKQQRLVWIEQQIKMLKRQADIGSGQYFELYEKKLHRAVQRLFLQYSHLFTSEETAYIKAKTGYSDNFKPYSEVDDNGRTKTIDSIINEAMV